jgi:hypothetical protein
MRAAQVALTGGSEPGDPARFGAAILTPQRRSEIYQRARAPRRRGRARDLNAAIP